MNKTQNNEKGFSVVEVVVVVVIVALIGTVGWLVYKNHHKTTTASITTTSATKPTTTTATTQPTDPTAGWNTYTLPKEKLTFRYPTTWTVENNLTDSNNDGIQFTSKTDSSFEILVGAGQDVAAIDNYDGNCVQQADPVTFASHSAYLDLVGIANTNAVPPSCSPASSTIQEVLLSQSSSTANVSNFFLTKDIPQPAAPATAEIVVQVDYNGPNGSTTGNKTISDIENDTDYKRRKATS
jgi:hypothetical protein